VPICEVVQHPENYKGKAILVRGLVWQNPDTVEFHGERCYPFVGIEHASNYKEDANAARVLSRYLRVNDGRTVDVVYKGELKRINGIRCVGSTCFTFELITSDLVAARRTSFAGPPRHSQ
jgi:hypothetical protein